MTDVIQVMQRKDRFMSLDLYDAYVQVPLAPEQSAYACFQDACIRVLLNLGNCPPQPQKSQLPCHQHVTEVITLANQIQPGYQGWDSYLILLGLLVTLLERHAQGAIQV